MLRKIILALIVVCTPLLSQSTTGVVVGAVTDPAGSVVASAAITLANLATGQAQKTVSDADGNYVFPLLPPATYRLTAEAKGFKQYSREFSLAVDQKARVE